MKRLVILALLAAMCALLPQPGRSAELGLPGGERFSVRVTSMKALRFQATLRQQYDFSCGSAALATLLTHHYHFPVDEQTLFKEMFIRGDQQKIRREGFSLLDMQRYLATRGFKADGFELPLQKLFDAKLPAIVLINEKGYHHFVVIKGESDGRILLGDPSSGTRAVARAHFEQIWSNKMLFVIHDTPGAPAFNKLADWRAAPRAPLGEGVSNTAQQLATLPKLGPGDF
ncbi:C39 family peptidase [Massilia sp. S19_KUP03_FR1]|uniref:C39 family peptidase n=1 Tax=Massilia sp. S19_KUP03_FR1 TaxID=3025503 RepID=UPI002FCDA562